MSSWDTDDLFTCPVCGSDECIPPAGPAKSPVLLIGDQPGRDEMSRGKPFCGATGGVLKAELSLQGIDINRLRMCNLWLHAPSGNKDQDVKCLEHSIKIVLQETKGKSLIVLMGSECVKYFVGENVSNVTGLKVSSSLLSAPVIMACINPAIVFHGTIGELRLSLEKIAREAKNLL